MVAIFVFLLISTSIIWEEITDAPEQFPNNENIENERVKEED